MNERQVEIDILRGIAILLVLLGHMIPWEGIGHTFIYSFHAPLFFFLSGYLVHKEIENPFVVIHKSAKRLLVPYIITVLVMTLAALVKVWIHKDWNEVPRMLLSYIWGGNVYKMDCLPLGPIWFLLALFGAKSILAVLVRYLRSEWVLITALIISFIGFALNDFRFCVPFLIILSLQVVVMMAIGWYWRHYGFPNWFNVGAIIIWVVMLFCGKMDVFMSEYSMVPMNIIGAYGASFLFMQLCHLFSKAPNWIYAPFQWMGKESMLFLCCHQLECFSGICITAWIQWQIHYFIPEGWSYIVHIGVIFCMVGLCLLCTHIGHSIVGKLRTSKGETA